MKKTKDIIKFIKEMKKKHNYHWEKEGIALIQKIGQKNYEKEELKNILSILLITEEMPNNFISNYWLNCSGTLDLMNENKGQYKKLVKAFNIMIKRKHPFYLYMERKMSVDLNRSFNKKIKPTEENIRQLRDILYAFTVRDVSLNYCQGFNTLVAYFLQMTNFKEEESFYLFLKIMENILPYDYYLHGVGIEAELNILNILLEKFEPDLLKHLNSIEGGMTLYSIFTRFVTSLMIFEVDRNITNFLFNCFFGFSLLEDKNEAFFYFYKISLAIFKSLKQSLMKCKNMEQVDKVIKIEKDVKKEVIQSIIYYTLFDDSSNKFDLKFAKKIRKEEINKMLKIKKSKFNYKNEKNIECDINYPICVEEWDVSSDIDLSVFYEKINQQKDDKINTINNDEDDEQILKDIICERRRHYCRVKSIKKKYNYHWEKEGKEVTQKISQKNFENKEELKNIISVLLLTENVPQNLIADFWLTCSGALELINGNNNQYKKLLKAFNFMVKNNHPFYIYMEKKMSVDLKRSFNHKDANPTEENINQLKNILSAFTVRNVSINYCQGLNTIVAYLLVMTNFKEEESYYLFQILMENILPYDYYLFGIGVEAELNIFTLLLEKYEPDLVNHLNNTQSFLVLFSSISQCITSLLIFKMNRNISNFVFNCFYGLLLLKEKEDIFFYFYKIILALIKSFKKEIMTNYDMHKINKILNFENEISKEKLEDIIYFTLFDDDKNNFDINYVKKIRKEEVDKILKKTKAKFNFKYDSNVECNISYPICVEDYNILPSIDLNVIHKNMNDQNEGDNNIINNEEDEEQNLKNIVIERRKHLCQKENQ